MTLESDRELSGIMGDAEGNFHFVYSLSNGKNKYVIVSSDGEVIFQAEGKHMLSLNAFGGGRVAVCDQERSSNGLGEKRFYEADLKSGELCELSVSKKLFGASFVRFKRRKHSDTLSMVKPRDCPDGV